MTRRFVALVLEAASRPHPVEIHDGRDDTEHRSRGSERETLAAVLCAAGHLEAEDRPADRLERRRKEQAKCHRWAPITPVGQLEQGDEPQSRQRNRGSAQHGHGVVWLLKRTMVRVGGRHICVEVRHREVVAQSVLTRIGQFGSRRQDLGFLRVELGFGEDALVLELGQIFELCDGVWSRRRRRRSVLLLRRCLLCLLLRPSIALSS